MISISQTYPSEKDIMFMFVLFLYILSNSAFSEASLANIFFAACGLSCHSPHFRRTEFLKFNEALLINAFLQNCAFDIVAGNHFRVCGFDGVTEVFFPSFLATDTFDSYF